MQLCAIQAGQQQQLELGEATLHDLSWLSLELDQHTGSPELDPTGRIFVELKHLEPQVLGCPQSAGIACAV